MGYGFAPGLLFEAFSNRCQIVIGHGFVIREGRVEEAP